MTTSTVVEFRPSKWVSAAWIDRDTYVGQAHVVLRPRYEVDLAVYEAEGSELHDHVTAFYYLAGGLLGRVPAADGESRLIFRAAAAEYARMGKELSDALMRASAEEDEKRHAAGQWYAWEQQPAAV